jgi:DNA-binding response OmpR family regulator
MSNPKVLVVEDEYLIRLTLTEALAEEGFEVIEAATGDEALALLCENDGIALLLTDIQLPGELNGLDLAQAVRHRSPAMPIIYMTGRPDSLPCGIRGERDVFIAKPYLPSEVCATVRRLTGG